MKIILVLFILFLGFQNSLAQQNILDSLEHKEYQRKYMVHLPPGYSEVKDNPVVIFLHGGNGNYVTAQGFTRLNQVSNSNDFVVVYPQGYFEPAANSFVWADGRSTGADKAGIDDVGFLDKLVKTLTNEYVIDSSRMYLCGFSNGSFMTQRMAFESETNFAAMGTLGGTLDSNLLVNSKPGKAIAMMYVFGMEDPFVPYEGGTVTGSTTNPVTGVENAVRFWVENNNCKSELDSVDLEDLNKEDNSTVTVFEYTDCDCDADVIFYKIVGGGHTWPGVEIVEQEPLLGETNEDINAGEELWKFFRKHVACEVTSVDYREESNIFLYPNPANEYVKIVGIKEIGFKYYVFDIFGNILLEGITGNDEFRIDLSGLSSGVYFVNLGNQHYKVIKL
jgi:polyhydroxybutyrate depolymerase